MATSLQGQPGAGGFLSGLDSLFKNKLFLQYLSAAGADIAQGTGGKNVNAATQQNIAAQNYSKLLAQMLGGDFSGGGKITMDSDGATFKVPAPIPQQAGTPVGSAPNQRGASPGTGTGAAPVAENLRNLSLYTSPFGTSQSGISASDLAGLSPEMIASALQFKFGKEEFEQRKLMDVAQVMHQQAMEDYYRRQGDIAEAGLGIEEAQVDVARANAARQWYDSLNKDERTAMEKEYDRAVSEGYQGYLEDWKVLSGEPETIKLWKAAVADGSFKGGLWQFIKQRAQAGATNINLAPAERALQTGGVEARVQLMDPAARQAAIDKAISNISDVQSLRTLYRGAPEEQSLLRNTTAAGVIEDMIIAGNGQVIDRIPNQNGNMVWIVKWPPTPDSPQGTTGQIVQRRY